MNGEDQILDRTIRIGLIALIILCGVIALGWLGRDQSRVVADELVVAWRACAQEANPESCSSLVSAHAAIQQVQLIRSQTALGTLGFLAVLVTLVLNVFATRAATKQARVAQGALEEAERPLFFIWAESIAYDVLNSAKWELGDFDAKVRVDNVGTRPAIVHSFRAAIHLQNEEDEVPCPAGLIDRGRHNRWEGGREFKPNSSESTWVSSEHLRRDVVDQLAKGAVIFLIGFLEYEDPLGILRERAFCLKGELSGPLVTALQGALTVFWRKLPDPKRNFDRRMRAGRTPAH